MWKLTANDLNQLRGGGGERFVHFVDRLIRATAARAGVGQSEIATQLRVNIGDGGVDTQVKSQIPGDRTGWFEAPTCWQFKAVDASALDKSVLLADIHKPFAKKLISDGYAYRFCLLGDLPPEKLNDWEAQLLAATQQINACSLSPRVIHGAHLLEAQVYRICAVLRTVYSVMR